MVAISLCVFLVVALTVGTFGQRETYQFLLDILDKLDPNWVAATHEDVRSKLQCATLCFRGNKTDCGSFGYKNNTCYLLKSSIDKESCSQDDCSDSGMKIYRWKGPEEKKWSCDPPDAQEVEVKCNDNNNLLNRIGSRSPFFGDVLSPACTDMGEQIFGDEEEQHVFFAASKDGISIKASCPKKHQIIVKLVLCVKKTRIPAMTLHCRELNEPGKVEDKYGVSNTDKPNLIDCGEAAAIANITFGPWPDNDAQTYVEFSCSKMEYDSPTDPNNKKP